MLSFFASKQKSSLSGDDAATSVAVETTVHQSQHPEDSEPRPSNASVPTIDSVPTVQAVDVSSPRSIPLPESPNPALSLAPPSAEHAQRSTPSVLTQSSSQSDRPMQSQSQSALPYSPPAANASGKDPRRFSFPSFSFLRSDSKQDKATSASKPVVKKFKAGRGISVFGTVASSEKRAKEAAVIMRALIMGSHNIPPSNKTKSPSRSDVARVKTQLLDPKTAAKVISQLRSLPRHANDAETNSNVPIHAVCLDMIDSDIHDQYFAQIASVATASISTVSTALNDVHLINLITAPNMGLGAPVTAEGLFAGAVPTAETVITGIEQITPQLMALGYATGESILPDHKGVFVPTDRLSALTYWWGFEISLPPPTIAHLEAAESPGSALLNLLTAISVLNDGMREIIPFIRYIAQFVQTEWSLIKRTDEGKGVVCIATWLFPIALVPRAWDFPDVPPPCTETPAAALSGQSTQAPPSVKQFSATLTTPKPSTEVPNGIPRSSTAYSTETRDEDEPRAVISNEPPVLPELVVSSPGSIEGAPPENLDGEGHTAYDNMQHDGEPTAH